ncbi:unnamed protein product [Cuscuta epithymum]|uniref:RING-type E3 ubiquitin transferase n=1 Tax=Cuscuta epithymum TaxID=186058 RepID=A0AAV0EFI3_9ASTE|nr:unnamed protein product [Cuscuta epithymum]
MSYNNWKRYSSSDHEIRSNGSNYDAGCCTHSKALAELKVYQACIFSVPIFFAFILLFLFYFFYLRRESADWSSLRTRASSLQTAADEISRCELGLKKELREMLPVIVFKESFSVKDSQCSVCLGEYEADERLQQMPKCGHTFHMDCIDHWLSTRTTCPLCRRSLLLSPVQSSSVNPTQNATSLQAT